MNELAEQHRDAEITRLDGVSVDYPDWHFNVRPSNTEPLLRLNLESLVSKADMEAKRDEVLGVHTVLTPEEALERAREAGIHRLRIPTPFAVGRVNCYLIEDEPLTLFDTGPNSGKSLDELQRQLDDVGHAIEEIELVVITHQHIDHLGLVEIVAARSGAEVAAIDLVVDFVERFEDDTERDDEFAGELMHRHGIPDDLVIALRSVSRSFRGWGSSAQVTRPLADGEHLSLRDRTFEVQHRPGHSPSDTVFWDSQRRDLDLRRPPDRRDLLEPVARATPGWLDRAAEVARQLPRSRCGARASCRQRSCSPATASRSPITSP